MVGKHEEMCYSIDSEILEEHPWIVNEGALTKVELDSKKKVDGAFELKPKDIVRINSREIAEDLFVKPRARALHNMLGVVTKEYEGTTNTNEKHYHIDVGLEILVINASALTKVGSGEIFIDN